MLTLYTGSTDGLDVIKRNDWYFSEVTSKNRIQIDDTVKDLIADIDEAECFYNNRGGITVLSPSGDSISLFDLSTGCKTALNIYLNPKEIFDTLECGNNAKNAILKLPRGNAVMHERTYNTEGDFEVNVLLVNPDGDKLECQSYSDCDRQWYGGWIK